VAQSSLSGSAVQGSNNEGLVMSSLQDFLSATKSFVGSEGRQAHRPYVLVDHAGAPGLMRELRRTPALVWTSLFEGSKDAGAIEVAPILIELPDDSADASQREFLAWLHRTCRFSTSVMLLDSTWGREPLLIALKNRLEVMLPDRLPVMLRYFDTRTVEALLRVLTRDQQAQFFGIASCWWWLDRAGELRHDRVEQLASDPWPHRYELDAAQQNALIDAGEADAIAAQMSIQAPDLCGHVQRAELHALAERCVPKAARLGIEDIRMRASYCLAALQLGEDFDSQPAWADVLGRVAKKQLGFEAALKEMGA
jgi:Domain of unknown function (DUF4123)